jgi:uncharacterized protein YndB with AHSA1/START domain
MTNRSAEHASFTVERTCDESTPAEVFRPRADPVAKQHWLVGPSDWRATRRELDFRVGGRERLAGAFPSGRTTDYDGRFRDIVPSGRIVFTYGMHVDDKRISTHKESNHANRALPVPRRPL